MNGKLLHFFLAICMVVLLSPIIFTFVLLNIIEEDI